MKKLRVIDANNPCVFDFPVYIECGNIFYILNAILSKKESVVSCVITGAKKIISEDYVISLEKTQAVNPEVKIVILDEKGQFPLGTCGTLEKLLKMYSKLNAYLITRILADREDDSMLFFLGLRFDKKNYIFRVGSVYDADYPEVSFNGNLTTIEV